MSEARMQHPSPDGDMLGVDQEVAAPPEGAASTRDCTDVVSPQGGSVPCTTGGKPDKGIAS